MGGSPEHKVVISDYGLDQRFPEGFASQLEKCVMGLGSVDSHKTITCGDDVRVFHACNMANLN